MLKESNSSGVLLGVDVGNTKTHALVVDVNGEILGFGEAGCGNYEAVGVSGFIGAMNQAIDAALRLAKIQKKQIVSMGFGISGYDWPSEKQVMIEGIESLGISAPYQYVNDVVLGILIGTSEGWGVAVDAGTGNNVRGMDKKGRIGRITGNSISFGEFGGANEIIQKAIIAVTYAWSLRGPKTKLSEMFMDYAKVDNEDALIEGLATDKIHPTQSLVKDVFDLALQKDPIAFDIVQWSAHDLGLNVNAVIRQLQIQNENFEIVLIGSIFRSGEIYVNPLRETIHEFAPMAKIIHLKSLPVYGSIILAAKTIGLSTTNLRNTLIHNPKNINLSEVPKI